MIWNLSLAGLAALSAFVMGYALNQGTTCAVLAVRQVLEDRRPTMLLGLGLAAATAGLVWLPLSWAGLVALTPDRAVGGGLIAGAVLLGAGAVLNRACLLGSISRIGDGRFSYLGLPAGLFAGFVLADALGAQASASRTNLLGHPSEISALILIGFGVAVWLGWAILRSLGDRTGDDRWSGRVAMTVLGVAGALLFAAAPGWTLADAIRLAAPQGAMPLMSATSLGLLMFALLCAGAVASGLRRRSFAPRPPRPVPFVRSLAGGVVMALGASMIPGGNDSLLLSALPSATLGGVTAYGVMTATIIALLWAGGAIRAARTIPA
ncbi:hypothetical protein IP78_04405 [Brevundimonas sp. AAP58]|uniref:YeeE/YedE thiosulfate transporter family protein n=1 Tax=Brevundimonas sp. AAP58 TaxID=1523422 RepID=UPI0006B9D138|nr:YeeE/YedE thiosulfate transporter family protein [Brevundimonas sp. AAP58]KPF82171.1 hypothetical protein IP78_04405 [Brevundimonas sp. AAP58]